MSIDRCTATSSFLTDALIPYETDEVTRLIMELS